MTISADQFAGLDLSKGDTLVVLDAREQELVIEIRREMSDAPRARGDIRRWIQSARGSVQIKPGESVNDIRDEYYAKKYGTEM